MTTELCATRWPALVVLWGFSLSPLQASTLLVSNLNDSGPGSLRQAIASAAPADTILFSVNGTILLTTGELVITNDLTIAGPSADRLAISANNASRVFEVRANTSLAISDLTITGGHAPDGPNVWVGYPSYM